MSVFQQTGASGSEAASAIAAYPRDASYRIDGGWAPASLRNCLGSAGVVMLVAGYSLYYPHFGSSSSVVDTRAMARVISLPAAPPSVEIAPSTLHAALALSVVEQAQEVLAALSLNKSQLADVLGVSRPTLYDWLDGHAPNAANAQRLTTLLGLLARAGITSVSPLSPRFLRQALREDGELLLAMLQTDAIDAPRVLSRLREAKALGEQADARRITRENRLRAMGFEEPSAQQRRDQLAHNIAMRDWPKG